MQDAPRHWYQPIAEFLGPAYLRNAFTKGTVQEIDFLVGRIGPAPARVLDAGCGPGRHAIELARRGYEVVGVDVSPRFVELAEAGAAAAGVADRVEFRLGDLRHLEETAAFDAAICLCQGGFGLVGGDIDADIGILRGLARALRPGGVLALTAFSAYFAVRYLEADRGERFEADSGMHHEIAELRDDAGDVREVALATRCFTATELRLLATLVGLDVVAVWGVTPGRYAAQPPSVDLHEHLLLARRPAASPGDDPAAPPGTAKRPA